LRGLTAAVAATTAPQWQDVLDTPAVKSPLAPRALVNGIARPATGWWRWASVAMCCCPTTRARPGASRGAGQLRPGAVAFPTQTAGWPSATMASCCAAPTPGLAGPACSTAAVPARRWSRSTSTRPRWRLTQVGLRYGRRRHQGCRAGHRGRTLRRAGCREPVLDVGFESESTGYLVGAFGLIFRTTDGGASWQPLLHATDNAKALHLYAVRAVAGEVYIVGEQGLLLKLDRAAGQFRAVELPYKGTLFGITGNGKALLVHGLRGTVLRSTDTGRSWTTVDTGLQVGLTGSTVDATAAS